jgi:hypothetical protein
VGLLVLLFLICAFFYAGRKVLPGCWFWVYAVLLVIGTIAIFGQWILLHTRIIREIKKYIVEGERPT